MGRKFLSMASGLGIAFGAAAGIMVFTFAGEAWHIAAGAAAGLIVGAIIGSRSR